MLWSSNSEGPANALGESHGAKRQLNSDNYFNSAHTLFINGLARTTFGAKRTYCQWAISKALYNNP